MLCAAKLLIRLVRVKSVAQVPGSVRVGWGEGAGLGVFM